MTRWRTELALRLGRHDLDRLTIHEAAHLLADAVPSEADLRDGWVRDIDGVRWFEDPQQAIAEGVFAATRRPYDPARLMFEVIGTPVANDDGLWRLQRLNQ